MTPTNPLYLIIATVYYILIALIAFFSVFSVYILIRYGRNKPISLAAAVLYCAFFLTLLQQSYSTLQMLK